MGKGRIVSGGEGGSYTVELLHNRERIERELEFLAARLEEMQTELDALNAAHSGLVAERNAIATDIDSAVASAEEGEIPDVEALLVALTQVSAQVQALDVRIAMIQGRMLEATKRQQMLQSVPANPQQQAWCADYTENLTGEVATVEVPAEGVVGEFATWRRVHIRPGYAGRANYSAARDGQMFHREGQAGYQAYFNAAILPGVQRWKPQYRIGTITSIDRTAHTCSLTIQGEDSSAQSLILDPPDLQYTKNNVPIEYMECNSQPFEVGDRVLVEFPTRDWNVLKVIGFESEPKDCAPFVGGMVLHFSMDWRQIEAVLEAIDAWFNDPDVAASIENRFYLSVGYCCRIGFGRTADAVQRIPMTRDGFGSALQSLRARANAAFSPGWEDVLDADHGDALGYPILSGRPLTEYESFYGAVDTGMPELAAEKRLLINARWEQINNTTQYLADRKPRIDAMTNHRAIALDYDFSARFLDMSDASFMSTHETILNAEAINPANTAAIRDLIIQAMIDQGIAPEDVPLPV